MQGKSLLERLRLMEKTPDWRGTADPAEILASVLHHVRRMLNARQNSVPCAPDYGMPDFTNIASSFGPSDIPMMEQMLAHVIGSYEPRLKEIEVQYKPTSDRPHTAVFSLKAQLILPDTTSPVFFETLLMPDGHIRVSE